MPIAMVHRFRVELRDLLELVLLPGLAAVLPWRWCFTLFKLMARMPWLYREPCEAALAQARNRGWAGADEARWIWVRRLVTLVDHADHYLGLWRSDAWMRKHLRIHGVWPDAQQGALLLSFHWGAGYWGLRHAAANGLRPHALVATLSSQAFKDRTIMARYARARHANVACTLGAPTIDVALQLKQVVKALRDRHTLLGVVDVPADEAKSAMTIELLGMHAYVPRALFRLAVNEQVPVTVYITGLNIGTGQRFLRITQLGVHQTVETLAEQVFAGLAGAIAEDPPAWHFWSIADRFFTHP